MATLRLRDAEGEFTLGQLLDQYLLNLSGEQLLQSGSITSASLTTLRALQDLVYACDDLGRLTGIFPGISFRQNERELDLGKPPDAMLTRVGDDDVSVIEVAVNRANAGYDRNWPGFHRRRWANDAGFFSQFVLDTLAESLGLAEAEATLQLDTPSRQLKFVETLAYRIWSSDFENYSRFTGEKLMFKTGDETVRNIAAGAGGICTEKVQALKFLTDHYGLESEYLLGGNGASGPLPVSRLREMLQTFDFRFARRYMRYWQHAALLYHVDGLPLLVDATNGNIPFLCLYGDPARRLLRDTDKQSVKVRMVEAEEDYFYHRSPQDIPLNLFFALEGWLTDTDMVQVFENELGLYLSREYYLAPLPFRSDAEYARLAGDYREIARRAGFACQVSNFWTLETDLGRQFAALHPRVAEKILAAKEHLLLRYNEWDLPGHDAGLVIMRMA